MNSTIRRCHAVTMAAGSCLVFACTISDHSGKRFEGESGGGGQASAGGAGGSGIERGGASNGGAGSSGSTSTGGAGAGSGISTGGVSANGGANASGGAGPGVNAGAASVTGGASTGVGGAASAMGGGVNAGLGGGSSAMGGAVTAGLGGASTSSGGSTAGGGASVGGDGCGQELLRNPGFEEGNANWALNSDYPGVQAIVGANDAGLMAEGVAPREGNSLAWLGGIPDNQFESYYVGVTQVIHIPQGTSALTLKGYVRIKTQEPDPKNTFDRGYIQFEWPDDRPDLLWLPVEWRVDQANSDWVPFSFTKTDTAQMAGNDVMIRLQAETDPSLETSFWLDSLSLTATCGR